MDTPDLTAFTVMHRGMRTDAHRLAAAVAADVELGRTERAAAMRRWYAGHLGDLHAHHHVEDEVFFPSLQAREPAFVERARLHDDHVRLAGVLDAVDGALAALATAGGAAAHREAVAATAELAGVLDTHLGFEDAEVLPRIARSFTGEEYEAMEERARRLVPVGVGQLWWTVPWIGSAATDRERAHLLAHAPLAMRVIWYASRGRYRRLATAALGPAPAAAVPA